MSWTASILAYADNSDTSALNLEVVMICLGLLLAAAAVAFVPVAVGWSRRHARSEAIVLAAVVWGLLAAASVARAVVAQIDYSVKWEGRVKSGYYDPADRSDAPTWPWKTWSALGAGYCGLLAWSLHGKGAASPRARLTSADPLDR